MRGKGRQKKTALFAFLLLLGILFLAEPALAARESGEKKYYDIAVSHARTTMKNHFREDSSSWHVVDYDPETGQVRKKQTHQGYSDNSAWARGQAWGLYGYTMCYRETGLREFLDHAERIAAYMFSKSLTLGFLNFASSHPPSMPTPSTGLRVKKGAVIAHKSMFNG